MSESPLSSSPNQVNKYGFLKNNIIFDRFSKALLRQKEAKYGLWYLMPVTGDFESEEEEYDSIQKISNCAYMW